ncbi:MAG: hypothetical protein U9O98_07220 [Asgard group archaeon]|nr:hypothetical protein [Asgard group archaeon]
MPDIFTFRVRFAVEEGFWIKYLTLDFPSKLTWDMKKLFALEHSLFGDKEADREDSALYIIERAYVRKKVIEPLIDAWLKDHPRSNYRRAICTIISLMQAKAQEKACYIVDELQEQLRSKVESVQYIISELPAHGFVKKALNTLQKVKTSLEKRTENQTYMDKILIAELIIENQCLMRKGEKWATEQILNIWEEKNKREIGKKKLAELENHQDKIITDRLSLLLTKIGTISKEKFQEHFKEILTESYDESVIRHHNKPSQFAKNILKRILLELEITSATILQLLKKVEHKMMYVRSPLANKEYPHKSLKEKTFLVIQEIVEKVIDNIEDYKRNEDFSATRDSETVIMNESAKTKIQQENQLTKMEEQKQEPELTIGEQLRKMSDQELWVSIRERYLRKLFELENPLDAAIQVLKYLSLELGMLITEVDVKGTLTEALKQNDIELSEANQEELDKTLCKKILDEVKELID